jgi:hypothetical protein
MSIIILKDAPIVCDMSIAILKDAPIVCDMSIAILRTLTTGDMSAVYQRISLKITKMSVGCV